MNRPTREQGGSPFELTLRLQFTRDSVHGSLSSADGLDRTFTGWLGLLSALERYRPSEEAGGEEPPCSG